MSHHIILDIINLYLAILLEVEYYNLLAFQEGHRCFWASVASFYAALSGLLLLGGVLPRALPWATVVRPIRACLKPQWGDIYSPGQRPG